MSLAPRTPVLVGVGAVQQREEDPDKAREPLELMIAALERAAEDAGSRALLGRANAVFAPRGLWSYPDPCRLIGERFGAPGARTEVAEVGVLQTTLVGRAAEDIARGRAEVVLVTGGEARFRSSRAKALGREAPLTRQAETVPDSVLRPTGEIVSLLEIRAGLGAPVTQYAMIENALRAQDGLALNAHRREVAELWSRMSRVAADNPDAWSRDALPPDSIGEPDARNRMLAFPYTKRLCSQWNVDQAAGLVLCSVETASALGIPRERWVFPLSIVGSDHMLPLCERRLPHRSPGFELAAERALARAERPLADATHLELYSCFPSAVRVQQRELGIPTERATSVTGGMTFAGGPLNSFVLQALVRMAQVLREDPGSVGLVTAVSGILTKQGVMLWSTEAGPGFSFENVTRATEACSPRAEVVESAEGSARVVTYTVLYEDDEPRRSVLLCELEDGRRTLATAADADLAAEMTREEFCGRELSLAAGGGLIWG